MSTANLLSNRYELGDTLGYGGMSEVHHGHDVRLGREVAIKILRADLARDTVFQERFRREAQNSAALNHPAIVAVYDTGETTSEYGPLPYIVMEFVEGRTLRDIVKTEGPMDQKRAMEVMADVCAALDFSHRHGIIHRDVKPANVMISKTGAVKVMDFGIARAIHDGQAAMTQTAAVIGTAQYLSPEQARGESVDARSDVYAAGCVLFELVTGEPPFTGDSPVAVAYQHVREDPPAPSDLNPAVSPELDAVVLKALTKGPANRYQSAAEMRSDLVRVLSNQRPAAPMVMTEEDRTQVIGGAGGRHSADRYEQVYDPDAEEEERKRGRRRLAVVLAIAAVIAAGVIAWLAGLFDGGEQAIAVPNVVGQQREAAVATLREAGFTDVEPVAVKCIPTTFGGKAACSQDQAQRVIAIDPDEGAKVAASTPIKLSYGVLPKAMDMPKVEGKKEAEALKSLKQRLLLVDPNIEQVENDDPKKAGRIAEQTPPAGEQVFEGDEVTLTVFAKPEMVEVTDYTGKTVEEATAGLKAAGFDVETNDVDSDQEKGIVVKQDPKDGKAVKGETIVLDVSNGADSEIEMPDVIDDTEDEARQALEGVGHTGEVKIEKVPTDDESQNGTVQSSDPADGETLKASDTVTLFIYEFEDDGGPGNGGDPPPCEPWPVCDNGRNGDG